MNMQKNVSGQEVTAKSIVISNRMSAALLLYAKRLLLEYAMSFAKILNRHNVGEKSIVLGSEISVHRDHISCKVIMSGIELPLLQINFSFETLNFCNITNSSGERVT